MNILEGLQINPNCGWINSTYAVFYNNGLIIQRRKTFLPLKNKDNGYGRMCIETQN